MHWWMHSWSSVLIVSSVSQTPQRLPSSAACWQPPRGSVSPWTAPSAVTAPHDSNSPMDFGARVERLSGWEGWDSDAPPRPPQANITFLPVLYCHSQGEAQDQMRSAAPGSQSTGHCEKYAHHMWAKAWFCWFSYVLIEFGTLKCLCGFFSLLPPPPVSPKDVVVQVNSLMVLEGSSALLVCSCKADPPATEYHWSYSQHGRMVQLHQRTPTVRLLNVTRNMTVRCSAKNLIGRGESHPTKLDVYCNSLTCCLLTL